METAKIERINELYRKSKAEGLTAKDTVIQRMKSALLILFGCQV